jgi:hypothetical protein
MRLQFLNLNWQNEKHFQILCRNNFKNSVISTYKQILIAKSV